MSTPHFNRAVRLKRTLPLLVLPLVLGIALCPQSARAASTDIVPRGSGLLDAFATLAQANAFGAEDTPEDFLGEPLYTRGQLAQLLEHLIADEPARFAAITGNDRANTALHTAVADLKPELTYDNVDLAALNVIPPGKAAVSGYIQPELRVKTGGDKEPGTGVLGLYRVTAQGNLRSNLRYSVVGSNWAQDERRVFNQDVGAHDFSGLSEAALMLDGGRGLTVTLGRLPVRWGPGYRGTTMVSDNAPPLDQLQIAFPFSLGARFGRAYNFTQLAATFEEGGTRKYFAARRIEYKFNSRLSAEFEEGYKSSSSQSLYVSLLPDFYNGQSTNLRVGGLKIRGLDQNYNGFLNFGAAYAVNPDTRFYGQFGIDDLQSPGHQSYRTPRKIAYLVGTTFRPAPGTDVVAEYSFADATTYTSRIPETQWQKGLYNNIGLPAGPNSREVFLRLRQKVGRGLHVALEGRDRRRRDDSFPEPNSRDYAATLEFAPNQKNGFEVTYHDYRQDAFPISPTVPLPGDGFTPANAEGNYGQNLRIRQLDVSYRLFF